MKLETQKENTENKAEALFVQLMAEIFLKLMEVIKDSGRPMNPNQGKYK